MNLKRTTFLSSCLLCLSTASFIAACSGNSGAGDSQASDGLQVRQGTVTEALSSDGTAPQFLLIASGSTIVLEGAFPPRELINKEVEVRGIDGSNANSFTAIEFSPIDGPDESGVRSKEQAFFSNTATPGTMALLMIKAPGAPIPLTNEEVLDQVMNNPNSARAFFDEASFGEYQLDVELFGWYDVDLTDCRTGFAPISQTALNQAIANDGLIQSDYQLAGFLMMRPDDPCVNGGGGVGNFSNGRSWYGANDAALYAHEIGHNLGLFHASGVICRDHDGGFLSDYGQCFREEYHDPLDTMGWHSPLRHFNAHRKANLGWIPPSNVTQVTASGQFVVHPQEVTSTGTQSLLIPIPNSSELFHVEVRSDYGFDAGLGEHVLVRKVTPFGHQQTYLIDMSPTSSSVDAGEDMTDSSLAIGQTYHDQRSGISIELVGFEGQAATIGVILGGPSCSDSAKNGEETGVDCGGPCSPCDAGQSCSDHWDCVDYSCEAGACVNAAGGGLSAEFFRNADLTNSAGTQNVPTVDFDVSIGFGPNLGQRDDFSIRYTGQVVPRYSETYTFTTTSDDRVRLWVDGQQLIDDTYGTYSGQITLVADEPVDFQLEFEEYGGDAYVQVRWESASQASEVIPKSRLNPTNSGACTMQTAINLGPHGTTTSITTDACVLVNQYPSWWQYGDPTLRLQIGAGGSFPVAFTYEDACGDESGTGAFTNPWQQQTVGQPEEYCPMLVQLHGTGEATTLQWF